MAGIIFLFMNKLIFQNSVCIMKLKRIPPIDNELINVIIETPRSNQNKFDYDEEYELFRLHKTLPAGMVFPFDFGFIPNTKAEDGDPMDVLVIMDQHSYPGCLVPCRPIGIIEAEQTEKKKQKVRNDRVVAVAESSTLYSDLINVKYMSPNMAHEIESFFIDYNKQEGKVFKPLRWSGIRRTMKIIKSHIV